MPPTHAPAPGPSEALQVTLGQTIADLAEAAAALAAGEADEHTARTLDRLAEELAEEAARVRCLPAPPRTRAGHTWAAAAACTTAVDAEPDFAGWLGGVLAVVAARFGSADKLTARRPGSWEASLVDRLTEGTLGAGYAPDLSPWRDAAR